jgi:hypothetical protein
MRAVALVQVVAAAERVGVLVLASARASVLARASTQGV